MSRPIAVSLLFLAVVLCASRSFATVVIGGYSFHDNAFGDVVLDASPSGSGQFMKETASSSQPLTLPADFAILEAAVLGSDVSEWVSLRTADARLTIGFTDLIPIDGPGDDIAIVEIGATAPVQVTINGNTQNYVSQPHGSVNLVLIDLSDFSVAQTASVTIASQSILNDIAAVGALNYVPEPSASVLGGFALIGLGAAVWRKRRD